MSPIQMVAGLIAKCSPAIDDLICRCQVSLIGVIGFILDAPAIDHSFKSEP